MLIYNSTYFVPNNLKAQFLRWMRDYRLPAVAEQGVLTNPRVTKVLGVEQDDQTAYALQLEATGEEQLNQWKANHENAILQHLYASFSKQVMCFSTTMEVLFEK